MGGKGKVNENGLTEKEQEILDFIIRQKAKTGYPPTLREMGEYVGLKSPSSVYGHLLSLESMGWIRRDPTKPRAIEILKPTDELLTEKGRRIPYCEVIHAPIIGDVAAGIPILAEQNIDGYCPLPAEEYGGKDLYMLRVHGDSMINAGIYDGDRVIVEACDTADNGEIVVALIEDSATIKRFFKESGRCRLQPENDTMPPMYFERVKIQGKVIGLLRKM